MAGLRVCLEARLQPLPNPQHLHLPQRQPGVVAKVAVMATGVEVAMPKAVMVAAMKDAVRARKVALKATAMVDVTVVVAMVAAVVAAVAVVAVKDRPAVSAWMQMAK